MRVLHRLGAISVRKTLALWGISIGLYAGAYISLAALGHPVLLQGTPLTTSVSGALDALYYSALHAFSVGFGQQSSSVVINAVGSSQLAVSAGFFGLFVHKAAKSAAPYQRMHPQAVQTHLNKILSKLYIFRYDMGKLLDRAQHGTLTRHHMRDLWITASGVDTAMIELHELVSRHLPESHAKTQERLVREEMFKRVIAAVDSAFWNLACLLEECSRDHIKWNYSQNLESLGHNTIIAQEVIQTLATYPVEKETLYQLRAVQKTFAKLNKLIREKEDIGFDDLPDIGLSEALEREIVLEQKR